MPVLDLGKGLILLIISLLLFACRSGGPTQTEASPGVSNATAIAPPSSADLDHEPHNMQGMVARHNYYRAEQNLPPLVWSGKLAAYAENWALELKRQGCKMKHRPRNGKWEQQFGENIYWSKNIQNSPGQIVDSWASEKSFFDYKTCNYTTFTSRGESVGHYTQIMWRSTTQVGCAVAHCGDEQIWVCNYNPPGNWSGEKPY